MATTYQQYPGNGTNRNFAVPFSYLDKSHVKLSVNGVAYTDFIWLNAAMIQTATAPAAATIVDVRRVTPTGTVPVNFVDGSILAEAELDLIAVYAAYLAEESRDFAEGAMRPNLEGNLDARNLRIANVAPGVAPTDAVNKAQNDATMLATGADAAAASGSAASALASKNAAGISETNAAASAASALTSQNAAATSATNAGTAETNALASKNAAGISETNALASKNAAATSATNAGTSETNALASKNAAAASAASVVVPQNSARNLLMNGNFNVNQRAYVSGVATGTANQYTLDRWRVVTSGQNLSYAASGNGRVVTAPAGGIEQVIEGSGIGVAQCTINWVGTATCLVDGVAKAKSASVTLVPGTNSTVRFVGGTVSQAQLEAGTVPTSFEFRPYGLELALCQRYFCIFDAACGSAYPSGSSGATASTVINFPVPMRTSPAFAYGPLAYNNNAAVNIAVLSNLSCTFQITIQAAAGLFSAAHTGNTASAEF